MMNILIALLLAAGVLLAVGWWGEDLGFMWGSPFVYLASGVVILVLDVTLLAGWASWSYFTG